MTDTTNDITNATRTAWAEAAIHLFTQLTGCDREDALGDLLANLMHWSHAEDFDFDIALDRARAHFEAELLEELPPSPAGQNPDPELLHALEQAVAALNTAPRFAVPSLNTDSYRIAKACNLAIANAKGGAQ